MLWTWHGDRDWSSMELAGADVCPEAMAELGDALVVAGETCGFDDEDRAVVWVGQRAP